MNLLSWHLSGPGRDGPAAPRPPPLPSPPSAGDENDMSASNHGGSRSGSLGGGGGGSDGNSGAPRTFGRKRRRGDGYQEALGARGIGTVGRVLGASDEHMVSLLDGRLSLAEVRWLKQDLARKTKSPALRLSELVDRFHIYGKCLSTGSRALNALLGGGVLTGELTELAGGSASGKTQACLSAVAALLLDCSSARAVFVDTCNCFNAGRLREIILARLAEQAGPEDHVGGDDPRLAQRADQCLSRVRRVRAFDIASLVAELTEVARSEADQHAAVPGGAGPLRLLVLDSITSVFARSVGGGARGAGSLCFAAMGHVAQLLRRLADQLNLAVLLTNSVVLDGYGSASHGSGAASCKPALGRTWSKEPDMRLQLAACGAGTFQATLTKSCKTALTGRPVTFSVGAVGLAEPGAEPSDAGP